MGDTQFERLDAADGLWFWVNSEGVRLASPTAKRLGLPETIEIDSFFERLEISNELRLRDVFARGGVQVVRIDGAEHRLSISPTGPDGFRSGELHRIHPSGSQLEEDARYQRRFQLLADILPLGVMLIDNNGSPRFANSELHRMMNLTESRTDADLAVSMVHPDDVERVSMSFGEFMTSASDDWTERYRIVSDDGREIPVENRCVRERDASGATLGFVSYLQDLSPEASAADLLEGGDPLAIGRVGHWTWNSATNELAWSDSMYEIFQVGRDEPIDMETAQRHVPKVQQEMSRREVQRAHEEGRGWDMELDVVFPSGETRRVISRGRSFTSEDGIRFAGMVIDVTAQREREQQVRQAEKLRAIGQLASGVAHDFNNMLGAILGNATVLSEEVAPELQRPVAEITIAAERVTQLTRQLLTFSRRQQLERGPVNVHELLDEVFTLVAHSFSPRITIKRRFAASSSRVVADASQIQSAFLNLLVNARDALSGTAGTLEITTENVNIEGVDWIEIQFADDGPGMDEETQRRAFEPFYTTRRETGGTGLGLSATYGAVLRHGGSIDLESKVGQGTRFTIRLELDGGDETEEPLPRRGSQVDGGGATIWVVDDEPLMRSLALRVLERAKFQVRAFESGEQVLDAIGSETPSVLVIDHHMPGISGTELIERLRRQLYDGTVVVVTGNAFDVDEEWAASMAVSSIVEKPYAVADLLTAVQVQ